MKRKSYWYGMESIGEIIEQANAKRELGTTALPPPPRPLSSSDVRQLRDRLNASQAVFARYLNVSAKLVQAWEAGRRTPEGPALLLLRLMERSPTDFVRARYPWKRLRASTSRVR